MTVASPKLRLKTDNHSLPEKCQIRREVIARANLGPLRVLDLFAGEGHIWNALRRPQTRPGLPAPLNVEAYTPVDSAAKQMGQVRFKITRRLIASFNGDDKVDQYSGTGLTRYNVIDIDTYGDPFEIWQALLFRIKTKTVVFLTRGKVTYGAGRMPISKLAKHVMGIPEEWDIPGKIELLNEADKHQLLQSCPTARIQPGTAPNSSRVTITNNPRVDYYGLIVEPHLT